MMERLIRPLLAAGAGAGAMYLLDPQRGAQRRAHVVEGARSRAHAVEQLAAKAGRDVSNRARGLAARAQGSSPTRESRGALSEGTPERRILEGGGGALIALWGLARGGLVGTGALMAGAALVARAALARDAQRMIRVQKTITIGAPVKEVYDFWSKVENFPRFMEHVLEVRSTDADHTHWRVQGPAGIPVEWDAEVVERLPERSIAWRSLAGSTVEHHGEVHFEEVDGGTRLTVHMAYLPPGGALTHGVAAFLHGDPKTLMDADLLRLKTLLEYGKSTAHGAEVRLDEVM